MKEFELIRMLSHSLPANAATVVGAGDDCAVIDLGLPDRWVLFKTDAVVAGVHFTETSPPAKVGHKALGRCLSDVAAMAGTPVAALVTLALPPTFDPAWVAQLYDGLNATARRYEVAIVGGETTTCPERILISVALLGTVSPHRCVRRTGAKPGDAIFVTGELGGSLAGRHLEFEPRLEEARWLANHFPIHAMLDLSDGLASDIRHLLAAGCCGAELLASAIPISRAARALEAHARGTPASEPGLLGAPASLPAGALDPEAAKDGGVPNAKVAPGGSDAGAPDQKKSPLAAALTDGEDFELLFTVAANDAVPLLDAWKQQFPHLALTCIGKITAEPGVRVRRSEGVRELTEHGYEHFV